MYGKLSCALIEKDKVRLGHLLSTDVTLLSRERFPLGQTALHLAVLWPDGLKLLLDYGSGIVKSQLNTEDSFRLSPLDLAIRYEQWDSISILIEAKASLSWNQIIGLQRVLLGPNCCRRVVSENKIMRMLIETFANRRKELLHFAQVHLPAQDVAMMQLQDKAILDYEVDSIIELLEIYDIPYPSYLANKPVPDFTKRRRSGDLDQLIQGTIRDCNRYHFRSIYNSTELDSYLAQQLWNNGFHPLPGPKSWFPGISSRLNLYLDPGDDLLIVLEKIAWLERHGADMKASVPYHLISHDREPLRISIIHWTASFIGSVLHRSLNAKWSEDQYLYVCHILSEAVNDSCECFCLGSERGCIPATLFTRAWIKVAACELRGFDASRVSRRIQRLYPKSFRDLATSQMIQDVPRSIALRMVRVMTFAELGMKHTCCQWNRFRGAYLEINRMDPTEIDEIRKEDAYLNEHLDNLMCEFSAAWGPDVSFSQFLEEIWEPRMEAWK